ncbi:DUF4166 domain-containing protein [Metabacillus indicus]|uniref:DUF4166 domain-containing protein n=1 Tax=Metabacillus indicus TaxID=246786 RepID=UPI003CEB0AE0
MAIYQQVLREDYHRLHPALQKRYQFPFRGNGMMHKITGGPKWLYPLFLGGVACKLLFPERGENIPFTIVNSVRTGPGGEQQVHWERVFYFPGKKRWFNALMSLDGDRNVIKDYLGEPGLFYSDLTFYVTDCGNLRIESGNQRLVIGKLEIPLPKILQGLASVEESFDETKGIFTIQVEVTNPLIGPLFSYEGEFVSDERL